MNLEFPQPQEVVANKHYNCIHQEHPDMHLYALKMTEMEINHDHLSDFCQKFLADHRNISNSKPTLLAFAFPDNVGTKILAMPLFINKIRTTPFFGEFLQYLKVQQIPVVILKPSWLPLLVEMAVGLVTHFYKYVYIASDLAQAVSRFREPNGKLNPRLYLDT
jgi:hypothetical protein